MSAVRVDRRLGQRGIALPTAVAAALVISITALAVLGLTMRRLDLSVFRSDHAVAMASAEAGIQCAFSALAAPTAFEAAVRAKAVNPFPDNVYLLSTLAVGTKIDLPYNGGLQEFTVDEQSPILRMGWDDAGPAPRPRRNVHVLIEEFAEVPPVVPPRLRIHAYSDFGTAV